VQLSVFEAIRFGFTVGVRWLVEDPEQFSGYELERAPSRDGPFTRLTPEPISPGRVDGEGFIEQIDPDPIEGGWYRLRGVARDGATQVLGLTQVAESGARAALTRPILLASGPNPTTGAAVLRFRLPATAARQPVDLFVYDAQGRRVAAPVTGEWLAPGEHRREWLARDGQGTWLPAGAYYVRLRIGAQVSTRKLSLVR